MAVTVTTDTREMEPNALVRSLFNHWKHGAFNSILILLGGGGVSEGQVDKQGSKHKQQLGNINNKTRLIDYIFAVHPDQLFIIFVKPFWNQSWFGWTSYKMVDEHENVNNSGQLQFRNIKI